MSQMEVNLEHPSEMHPTRRVKEVMQASCDSGLSFDLSDIEEMTENAPSKKDSSSSADFEKVFKKSCLLAENTEDEVECFLAPCKNHIKETDASSQVNNNETLELDQAADKMVEQMLSELSQPPVRLRHQPQVEEIIAPEEPSLQAKADEKDLDDCDESPPADTVKIYHVNAQEDCYLAPELKEIEQLEEEAKKNDYKMEIVWANVAIQVALHAASFYGLYLAFTSASWMTNTWMFVMSLYAGNSITAGAHRMWTHKAYKANFWVRLFFMIGTTMSVQNDVIEWARDHRVHHKWADSDADPHNINRGFFFAHMGWLMVRKHPKVKEMGAKVDMSDLEKDPLLAFQRKYYNLLVPLSVLFLTVVPVFAWGESWTNAYFVGAILRLTLQLHGTWFINSAAHTFGYKPFDTKITAVDTFFYACLTNGEAWHNYHHTFPQDYRTSEYMWKGNMSAVLIDFFAYMGWVWDRKTMSKEALERQKLKGDYSRPLTAAQGH